MRRPNYKFARCRRDDKANQRTRDLAPKTKVLCCRHRHAVRGVGNGTFHGGCTFHGGWHISGASTIHGGWHIPEVVDFGPYLVDGRRGEGANQKSRCSRNHWSTHGKALPCRFSFACECCFATRLFLLQETVYIQEVQILPEKMELLTWNKRCRNPENQLQRYTALSLSRNTTWTFTVLWSCHSTNCRPCRDKNTKKNSKEHTVNDRYEGQFYLGLQDKNRQKWCEKTAESTDYSRCVVVR